MLNVTAAERKAGIVLKTMIDERNGAFICKVRVADLDVCQVYQRKHSLKHSKGINGKFVPYPVCSLRDGVLWIVDGQHRWWSERNKKSEFMYVYVLTGLTIGKESLLYKSLNSMKRPQTWNVFKAALAGGEVSEMEQYKITQDAGLSLKFERGNTADLHNTYPIRLAYEYDVLPEWCKVINCFKHNDVLHKLVREGASEFQKGILMVVRKFPKKIVTKAVLAALKRIGADNIKMQADRLCDCARTNQNHFAAAIEFLLESEGLLPQTILTKAA